MRILIVEDDVNICDLIRRGLVEQHYSVDTAHDGEIGLEMAWSNDYDLIILDLMLPKRDWKSVCKSLRSDGIRTPILMLTALVSSSDVIAGLDYGADDYMSKPFDFGVLQARVRALIRRPTEHKTAKIRIGDLTIDTAQRIVERNSRQINLTPKEFALLEYLALNRGKVLTREAISEHVWDINFDPKSNVIEQLMRGLRQKIQIDQESSLIHTVRGAGYRFDASM